MKRNGSFMESLVWHFYEHSFWKWHRNLPVFFARIMSVVNHSSKKLRRNKYYVIANSCDGSGQLTHPDVVLWQGKLWMAATPYPYSRETYEDPCVYESGDGKRWQPCRGAYPIEKIKRSEIGKVHFSDPVLLPTEDRLILYYRKRVRSDLANTDSLHTSCCNGSLQWTPPRMICESGRNNYISPAVLNCGEEYLMYHIDLYDHLETGSLIMSRSKNGADWTMEQECIVTGLAENTGLWHVAICGADGSRNAGNGNLTAMFVVKDNGGEYLGIYEAASHDYGRTWQMGKRLRLPKILTADMKKPYKAAFIPESTDLMISIEDTLGRWYLYRVPYDFEEE